MHTERYMFLRTELIRLYKLFNERTFIVKLPLASFLTLKQLEQYKNNPPLAGFESLMETVERPYTTMRILRAVSIMDENLVLGFRYPREDIPVLFKAIEDWIQYWIEIKTNADYLRTPDIKELELIEKLGRYIFTAYAHYHHEKINRTMQVTNTKDLNLIDVLRGRMMFGTDFDEPISYISHLDQYKSQINYTDYSSGVNNGTLDFLKGFGGGL